MASPANICVPLFKGPNPDTTVRATANVTGKTFGKISAAIQSGPDITTAVLPTTYDGGNLQAATCPAGSAPDGVFAYDQVAGQVVPLLPGGTIPVTAGATITAGQDLEVGANGRVIPLATGVRVGDATTNATTGTDCYVRRPA